MYSVLKLMIFNRITMFVKKFFIQEPELQNECIPHNLLERSGNPAMRGCRESSIGDRKTEQDPGVNYLHAKKRLTFDNILTYEQLFICLDNNDGHLPRKSTAPGKCTKSP